MCSVALSIRFPPDPQNGFSVDELNPRQNHGVWDSDFLCPGQKPRIEPVPLLSIGPKWGVVASRSVSKDGGSGQVRQKQKDGFQPSCILGLETHAN